MRDFQKQVDFPFGHPASKEREAVSKESRDQLLLHVILGACEKRKWKPEWIDIDLEAQTVNIDHSSITKEQTIEFFEEVFALAGAELEK